MTSVPDQPRSPLQACEISLGPGQSLEFDQTPRGDTRPAVPNDLDRAIGRALDAYTRAARKLVDDKYHGQRALVPPHMRGPCNVTIVRCADGVIVRYDSTSEADEKIGLFNTPEPLSAMAPLFSEQTIFFPQDPATFAPPPGGLLVNLAITDPNTGGTRVHSIGRPVILASTSFSDEFEIPSPPARPPSLVSVLSEIDLYMGGTLFPADSSEREEHDTIDFLTCNRVHLPVGWLAIEIYPLLDERHWNPAYGASWAERDLLAALASRNAITSSLGRIETRATTRKHYSGLLAQFEALLDGPEEPIHQFLKQHPELLSPTHTRRWSKLPFGDRISDFVFCEPPNDYVLVEIEAPSRQLFRKDGQQREELTHAINQVQDWIQFLADNRQHVQEELGLKGISSAPRGLVVIGRSSSLSNENRRKLETMHLEMPRLRILTYDDLLAASRAHLERILGPLSPTEQNTEIFYYSSSRDREQSAQSTSNSTPGRER